MVTNVTFVDRIAKFAGFFSYKAIGLRLGTNNPAPFNRILAQIFSAELQLLGDESPSGGATWPTSPRRLSATNGA